MKHCEVITVLEGELERCYQVQDLVDYRYSFIEHRYCADKRKDLKGVKREKPSMQEVR